MDSFSFVETLFSRYELGYVVDGWVFGKQVKIEN